MRKVRCAIYTRKSSEEGLEQDFNSLHAQREACAAYVLSQASESWTLLPHVYDDGGISGGTLARPALQRLLADIAAGQIDIIVVYKVDRLTRSLFDFAKLVETFDRCEVSFVSITQSFNTTTSMGRLTLNMLLSFAQFEREVTAERIRDKIAASKARGMWMGGLPPLGYAPHGRSLAIVEEHAALVRHIHARYLELGCVRLLAQDLAEQGRGAPLRTMQSGKTYGGVPFSRGQLYFLLKNPVYVGDIAHKDKVYPGQHPAILTRTTWDEVQARLASNRQGYRARGRLPSESILSGRIVDAAGEPLVTTHTAKGAQRYRYYVSRSLHLKQDTPEEGELDSPSHPNGLRLPAREIEELVCRTMAELFDDPLLLAARLSLGASPALLHPLTERCGHLRADAASRTSPLIRSLLRQVRALDDALEIEIDPEGLTEALGVAAPGDKASKLILTAPYRLTRSGRALRLIQADGAHVNSTPDAALVRLVVQARAWWGMLAPGEIDIQRLAEQEGRTASYVTRVVRLAFLSPAIVEAVLAGSQHHSLSAAIVRSSSAIPAEWRQQEQMFLVGR